MFCLICTNFASDMKKRVLFIILYLLLSTIGTITANTFTLVIDAGHGGKDAGAVGDSLKEKDINLNVALMFGKMVEQNCKDVRVIYTRTTDVFIELDERANIANRNKANLFISIHTNALPKGRIAYGFETYTLGMARANENLEVAKRENSVITYERDYKQKYEGFNPNSPESYIMFEFMQDKNMAQSVDLAKDIQKYACETAQRNDMGVHQAGFLVLRKTSMPSCLVELGFISTPDEAVFLGSVEGQSRLALGIYKAFLNYRNKHDKGLTTPYRLPKSEIQTSPFVQASGNNQANTTGKKKKDENGDRQAQSADQKQTNDAPQQKTTENTGYHHTLESVYAGKKGVLFKIQFHVSSKLLPPESELLKGLNKLDYYEEDGLFKYTTEETSRYKEISKKCGKIRLKYPEAFVIAIFDGKKIPVAEAIKK